MQNALEVLETCIEQATRVHGCTREAQPHMDVRLRRLPYLDNYYNYKFLEPLISGAFSYLP